MTYLFPSAASAGVVLLLVSLISTAGEAGQAKRKIAPAAKEGSVCAKLRADYEMIGKKLAWAKVRGDLGGGMAAARASQESASISEGANTTLSLMRSNGCKAPAAPPNRDGYLSAALDCHNDINRVSAASAISGAGVPAQPASCVMENWKLR